MNANIINDDTIIAPDTQENSTKLPEAVVTADGVLPDAGERPLDSPQEAPVPTDATEPDADGGEGNPIPEPKTVPETVASEPENTCHSDTPSDSEPVVQKITELLTAVQEGLASANSLTERVDSLLAQQKALQECFDAKLRYDATRSDIITRQNEELDKFRNDQAGKLERTVIMDLISEIDGAERTNEYYAPLEASPENYEKLKRLVLSYSDNLLDLLEKHDVISYRTEAGTPFNGKLHSALKTIPTTDPSLAKIIESSIRPGYERNGKIIRVEKVAVYVYHAPEPPAAPEEE